MPGPGWPDSKQLSIVLLPEMPLICLLTPVLVLRSAKLHVHRAQQITASDSADNSLAAHTRQLLAKSLCARGHRPACLGLIPLHACSCMTYSSCVHCMLHMCQLTCMAMTGCQLSMIQQMQDKLCMPSEQAGSTMRGRKEGRLPAFCSCTCPRPSV